jgi:hypothetical protein
MALKRVPGAQRFQFVPPDEYDVKSAQSAAVTTDRRRAKAFKGRKPELVAAAAPDKRWVFRRKLC